MEATRLAPAGRACSKFVWQGRFLKTGRFECLRTRAAPSFLQTLSDPSAGRESLYMTQPDLLRRGPATLSPRLGVNPRGRNAANGPERIVAGAPAGSVSLGSRGRNSLANSKRNRVNSARRA
jgi:hypothetical protein